MATYHIMDFSTPKETIETLEKDLPVVIVILPGSPEFRDLTALLRQNYLFVQDIEGAEIWFLQNPAVRSYLAK